MLARGAPAMSRLVRHLQSACTLLAWVGLLLLIGLWGRSYFVWDRFSHATGELIAPGSPGGESVGGWWTHRLVTRWVMTQRGTVLMGVDRYDSLAPGADELSTQWAPSMGWSREAIAATGQSSNRPWWRWEAGERYVADVGFISASRQGVESRIVLVPLWLIAAVVGAPMLLGWARRRRARRREAGGRCVKCGYDRRGLGKTMACPECGTP